MGWLRVNESRDNPPFGFEYCFYCHGLPLHHRLCGSCTFRCRPLSEDLFIIGLKDQLNAARPLPVLLVDRANVI